MPDAGDPKLYMAGAVAILAEYPAGVMAAIADPRSGTEVLRDYPTLTMLRRACEQLYEPFARAAEREQARLNHARALSPPRRPRTADEQARVDQAVAALRLSCGIPAGGLAAKAMQPAPVRFAAWDAERTQRLMDDLAARKARRMEG